MLENIKNHLCFNSIDKHIKENDFESALQKLNFLISEEFKLSATFLKRGRLCKKLLMFDDAYSDFTYIINHCAQKKEAYYERMFLNFEIANYTEAISDANKILSWDSENFEVKRLQFLSFVYSMQNTIAKEHILKVFDSNKFKALQFLFQETALVLAKDEFSKAIKLLEVVDIIDKNNPIKLLKEANIYGLIGNKEKQKQLLDEINKNFPKYFVSHFRFTDMYQDKDLLEICFLLELTIFDKQGLFDYPFKILEGYKNHLEGHIIDSKENFEQAIRINPEKPEGYILLAQTLQLMSGYDNPQYKLEAENNYKKAYEIYYQENLLDKAEEMKRQIKHLKSKIII